MAQGTQAVFLIVIKVFWNRPTVMSTRTTHYGTIRYYYCYYFKLFQLY